MRWPRFLVIPRTPDIIIGGAAEPYLRRWWLIPRNRWFNIYLHQFLRDDDDRALHDHPWAWNASILLSGRYHECLPGRIQKLRRPGRVYFRWGKAPHRIMLERKDGLSDKSVVPAWTIFITGPVVRPWGFYCPQGWRDWREFTNPADGGATVGRGCDD